MGSRCRIWIGSRPRWVHGLAENSPALGPPPGRRVNEPGRGAYPQMADNVRFCQVCTFRDFLILEPLKTSEKCSQSGNNGRFRRPLIPSRIGERPENPRKTASSSVRKLRKVQLTSLPIQTGLFLQDSIHS